VRLRYHLIVTQHDRDDAVNRIIGAYLEAHRLARVDGIEQGEDNSSSQVVPRTSALNPSSRAKARKPPQRPEKHGLLMGERLVAIYTFALAAGIAVVYLFRFA